MVWFFQPYCKYPVWARVYVRSRLSLVVSLLSKWLFNASAFFTVHCAPPTSPIEESAVCSTLVVIVLLPDPPPKKKDCWITKLFVFFGPFSVTGVFMNENEWVTVICSSVLYVQMHCCGWNPPCSLFSNFLYFMWTYSWVNKYLVFAVKMRKWHHTNDNKPP